MTSGVRKFTFWRAVVPLEIRFALMFSGYYSELVEESLRLSLTLGNGIFRFARCGNGRVAKHATVRQLPQFKPEAAIRAEVRSVAQMPCLRSSERLEDQ